MPDQADSKLVLDYLVGALTAGERAAFEQRLPKEPALARELAFLRLICGRASDVGNAAAVSDEWRTALSRRIAEAQVARPVRPVPSARTRTSAWRIAAAVLIAVGASLAGYLAMPHSAESLSESPAMRTIATGRGQRMSLRLPDGTDVTLAPASTLRFASTYGSRHRTLELVGHAVFTVTHDERRPFIVRAGDLVATDLGTKFVVRAYPDDSTVDVVVAEGVVAVAPAANAADSVVLRRGDHALAASGKGIALTHAVALESYFGWTDGELIFHRAPLDEVARQIERWYDVDIHLASPNLARQGFTGSFRPGESAAGILHVIATTLELTVVNTGSRRYTLRQR